ncbi:hypothetical protein CPY51_22960 [Rhizobium tubonense]|uniref:Uncharacterized protein n=1 Tax=Rhizobium tubonense TaxID=484088 RepID=A0A2W4CB20_9HYPH|nr:hypothetical protein CPY51_22960 [Rhizobium tubonense]
MSRPSSAHHNSIAQAIARDLDGYWPQLATYIDLVPRIYPETPLLGAAVFWLDHGHIELIGL